MIPTTCKQKQPDAMATEAEYFYYRGEQLINIIQGQSQSGQRFFQTATGLAAQINVGENAGTWLIGSDALGSVLAGSDGKDAPEEHRYTPYGGEKHQESTENVMKLGYTGAYRDPLTGLYPLGNGYRLYLPELMCFNKADSLSPFGVGGINTRSYCEGDPINYSDPSGHVKKGWTARETDLLVTDLLLPIPEDIAFPAGALAEAVVDSIEVGIDLAEGAETATATAETGLDETLSDAGAVIPSDTNSTESPLESTTPKTQENVAGTSTATAPKRPAAAHISEPLAKRTRGKNNPKLRAGHWDKYGVWEFVEQLFGNREIEDYLEPRRDYARTLLERAKPGILEKMGVKVSPSGHLHNLHEKIVTGIEKRNETLIKLLDYVRDNRNITIGEATKAIWDAKYAPHGFRQNWTHLFSHSTMTDALWGMISKY